MESVAPKTIASVGSKQCKLTNEKFGRSNYSRMIYSRIILIILLKIILLNEIP